MASYDNRDQNDYYLLFENDMSYHSYLAHKTEPKAKFRACDAESEHSESLETNGIRESNLYVLKIKTTARIDFKKNDIIYNVKTKTSWKVTNWVVADDDMQKKVSMRPRKWTYLTLQR